MTLPSAPPRPGATARRGNVVRHRSVAAGHPGVRPHNIVRHRAGARHSDVTGPGRRYVDTRTLRDSDKRTLRVAGQHRRHHSAGPWPSAVRGLLPQSGPQYTLTIATFVNTTGNGLFIASSALYFTRVVGMPASQVGLGLTLGALVGLVAGPVVGHAADRLGSREAHIVTMLCAAVSTAGFVLVRTFPMFLLVACLTSLAVTASTASRAPLIRGFGGDNPTRFLAYLRSVTNLGITLGALVAGVGIQLDTDAVYAGLVLGNAASFLGCATILGRLPHLPPVPVPATERRWVALTDRPYLAATLLNGAMSLHYQIPGFALPLWIVGYTDAPRWLVSAGLLVNTVMVVALQVRASKGVTGPGAAGDHMRRAGFALLGAVVLIAAAAGLPAWAAGLLLLAGVAVYTLGELWQSAASFELSFGLAAPHAQGQYSGVFSLGQGLGNAAAPAVLGVMCLSWGRPGWVAFGALMAVLGLGTPAVVRWAVRNRG